MDFGTWIKFLGTSQNDPNLKSALAIVGIKKLPKLKDNDLSVQFDLKGTGLSLTMTDEATLKKLDDLDVGEGPLIFSGALALLDTYKGALSHGVKRGMTQTELRKIFGKPTETTERPSDIWTRKEDEIVARYTKDSLEITRFGVTLPNVEF